jgi:hypothetical protein
VNLSNAANSVTTRSAASPELEPDWCVLVLYADDTERDIKGIWGPYTSFATCEEALSELRQWPLDGRWDVRRLNKFVARKAGNAPDQLVRWTWQ